LTYKNTFVTLKDVNLIFKSSFVSRWGRGCNH